MKLYSNCALLSLLFVALPLQAAHPFLCCDHNGGKVCVVSAEGKIEWEYACKSPQDCWRLANGNYLFCFFSGAIEITPDKKIVWEYKAPEKTEVHACQPLADGRVLVVECGTSRLMEVDRAGKIAKDIKLVTAPEIQTHNQYRGARKTKEGHYLVCFKGEGKVVELDGDGKVLRTIKVPGDPHEVVPLEKGHLLITCGDGHKVLELDALNPQVAARMARAFDRWKRFDKKRQGFSRRELERVRDHKGLSSDVGEIVNKALQ